MHNETERLFSYSRQAPIMQEEGSCYEQKGICNGECIVEVVAE
jgi:hypothetical protein